MRSTVRILSILTLLFLWNGLIPATLHAQRNSWTVDDVRPLTKLPWLGAEFRPLDVILDEIFREPDALIRYAVLDGYLSMIPVEQLKEAYDKCIILEGSQVPDQLVELLLRIWSRRDPHACWEKTKTLFELVGIEHGFLGYDHYGETITVQNRDAIRASRYWIRDRAAILGFAMGVGQSALPEGERVRLMKECADLWFARFKTWPAERLSEFYNARQRYSDGKLAGFLRAFDSTVEQIQQMELRPQDEEERANIEISLRRWLVQEPQAAAQILDRVARQRKKLLESVRVELEQGKVPYERLPVSFPSKEWLHLWRTLDEKGMQDWARNQKSSKDELTKSVRALLLGRVEADTRDQWLKEAAEVDPDGNVLENLFFEWANWEPKQAMEAAIKTGNIEIILDVPRACVMNGFAPFNTCHGNLGFLREFDVRVLSPRFSGEDLYDWGTEAMEAWGKIDVGEAARYGVDFLMKVDYVPRSRLITLFNGQSEDLTDTGDIIDRTFCCLRVWAVVRPDEMKAWIPSIQDPAMREALTYILEHPWGTGENAN
ncbi:hypothetical protein [Roseimicrobium sp. ORNL1]|uniref:hypothetical protein n=1 Tax=Roseimicrobium sp. ORNL1 TaxID=2711231 RepID=UPI0013E0FB57|nr:hypothetical protein [Roseimicrobium sp. ORNL1]QIF01673.1 hypothetical protein G5S37_09105 [Roseimicrobium sp. ORNL1]